MSLLTTLLTPINSVGESISDFSAPTADFSWAGFKITNLGNPSAAQDAATKAYVDTFVSGLTPITACRVATAAALTATYNNGTAGVGATLTNAGAQAALSIDGVLLVLGSRVLVKDQVAQAQNGVYSVATVGTGAVNWVLTRTTDFDTSTEITEGSYTNITEGTANGGSVWIETGSGPFVVGTTSIIFGEFGAFGTMASQNANAVVITGGNIDGAIIGATTPAAATVTTLSATGQPNFSGPTLIQKYVSANTGSAYAMDPTNGTFFDLTLTDNCTITVTESITTNQSQYFSAIITQGGAGGWTLAWLGPTWASGVSPTMPTAVGAKQFVSFEVKNGEIIGFSLLQPTDSITLASMALTSGLVGRTSGVAYSAGYVGEVISSNIAIGSATALTTATAKTITSINLTAGEWTIWGNIGFIAAAGTLPTILEGSISTTTNTQATSPNGGAYTRGELAYTAASTQICPVGQMTVNIGVPTTCYLVAKATFTVSTLTAYGFIGALRTGS